MSESKNCKIVGILNATPDSFYDGGQHDQLELALAHAEKLISEGADIIDVGGESSGPGSEDVSSDEELQRVIPIIEAIHKEFPQTVLSVDTTKTTVAEAAINAGASMINDVTAGRGDPEMFSTVAKANVPIVLMYSKDSSPRTTTDQKEYDDVIATIKNFLTERIAAAESAGISREKIILDPGLGFFVSANPQYSFEILERLSELKTLGYPLCVSPSRKSFLAGPENLPPEERLEATIAASAIAAAHGADYIRTHDVQEVRMEIKNKK
jgi:dihydropteroate synthase